jgi:hypothetical protein
MRDLDAAMLDGEGAVAEAQAGFHTEGFCIPEGDQGDPL